MQIFRCLEKDIKSFMNILYKKEIFEKFCVRNFEVESFVNYSVQGYLDKSLINSEKDFATWGDLRIFALTMLKEKSIKPKSIKLEFIFDDEEIGLDDKVKNYFLTMNYKGDELFFTTSVVHKEFSMDKTVIDKWNEYLINFFKENKIPVVVDEL